MSLAKFGIAAVILASVLSTTAYAAPAEKAAPQRAAAPRRAAPQRAAAPHRAAPRRAAAPQRAAPQRTVQQRAARQRTFQRSAAPRNAAERPAATRSAPNSTVGSRPPTESGRNTTRGENRIATPGARPNANIKTRAVRNTLNSPSVAGALRDRSALRNPHSRANITARAATAGWHDGRDGGNGWWRHSNGGYGWVGPLYWPFAYNDMYDYAMWGDGYDDFFWGYGYGDIYAGIFSPYGYDDLSGYLPQYASGNSSETAPTPGAPAAVSDQLTQMCGADSNDIAGLPIAQFQQAIQPTGEESAALDELANASVKASQDLKAACPTDIALTAPSRLAAMQQRIDAMIAAVATVQQPLEKLYGLLSDEQKARLTALGNDQQQSKATGDATGSPAQSCGAAQPGATEWPTAYIDQTVRPTEAERASLAALQDAATQAADLLKAACVTSDPLTPPARLAAVGKRLATMLQAVTMVSSALNDFYATLSDEQKARFDAIGPQRTAQLELLDVAPTPARSRGPSSPEQIIRRFLSPL